MPSQYTLTCVNKSSQTGSFIIFRAPPRGPANAGAPAWLTKSANPGSEVAFEWTADDSIPGYWVAFGTFTPGQVLDVGSITGAIEVTFPEPTTSHTVTLGPDMVLSVTA